VSGIGRAFRAGAVALGLMAVAMPIAIVLTLLLLPLWRWIEETWQIESVGHSGPADWCFVAVYLLCLALMGAAWAALGRGKRTAVPGPPTERR
jgi:hypothetical protein